MAKCKNISDCTTPRSCFGTFGACLNETTSEGRTANAEKGRQVERQLNALTDAVTRAPAGGSERARMVSACAHSWHDYGQLGGRNVSWCGKCDVLAFTGDEDVFLASAPASAPLPLAAAPEPEHK